MHSEIHISLLCFYLLLPYNLTTSVGIDGDLECFGRRPRLSDGCCPLVPGDQCDKGEHAHCDVELGYTCVNGLCAGKYNVTVTKVTNSTAMVTWPDYMELSLGSATYEYYVIYSPELARGIEDWSSHGVGDSTHMVLRDLTADTWYYVHVGVWIAGEYANLTEIIMFKTKALDHCLYNGRAIPVWEHFVINCEESCVCTPSGLNCVHVCRKGDNETPVCGEVLKGCCDPIPYCLYANCTYENEMKPHEHSWLLGCEENCTCYDGIVTCVSVCDEVTKPTDCDEPVLVKPRDGCCETWTCSRPEPGTVCVHDNVSRAVGSWYWSRECVLCTCSERTHEPDCVNVKHCGGDILPNPSAACPKPEVEQNFCCNSVVCQTSESDLGDILELLTVSTFSVSSIFVRFQFISSTDKSEVHRLVFFYTNQTLSADTTTWNNVSFLFSNATNLNSDSVPLWEFGKEGVLYTVGYSYFFILPNFSVGLFYYLKLGLEFSDDGILYRSDTLVTRLKGLGGLQSSQLPDRQSAKLSTSITFVPINISSSSVSVRWTIPENWKYNITYYVIKYKAFSNTDWEFSNRVIFSENNYTITCLHHSEWYEVELIAYPGTVLLGNTFFNTSSVVESPDKQLLTDIHDILIGSSTVCIQWQQLPKSRLPEVANIEVAWSDNFRGSRVLKYCVSPEQVSYTIEDLVPGNRYTARIGVNLKSGQTVYSNTLHFVTTVVLSTSHSKSNHSIVAAITISCVSLVVMIMAILTVVYITRCRRRRAYLTDTAFENRIFQIYTNREDRDV